MRWILFSVLVVATVLLALSIPRNGVVRVGCDLQPTRLPEVNLCDQQRVLALQSYLLHDEIVSEQTAIRGSGWTTLILQTSGEDREYRHVGLALDGSLFPKGGRRVFRVPDTGAPERHCLASTQKRHGITYYSSDPAPELSAADADYLEVFGVTSGRRGVIVVGHAVSRRADGGVCALLVLKHPSKVSLPEGLPGGPSSVEFTPDLLTPKPPLRLYVTGGGMLGACVDAPVCFAGATGRACAGWSVEGQAWFCIVGQQVLRLDERSRVLGFMESGAAVLEAVVACYSPNVNSLCVFRLASQGWVCVERLTIPKGYLRSVSTDRGIAVTIAASSWGQDDDLYACILESNGSRGLVHLSSHGHAPAVWCTSAGERWVAVWIEGQALVAASIAMR